MKLWTFLLQVWSLIIPYLTPTTIPAIEAAIEKAVTDYNGGNYVAVVNDLIDAIKAIIPSAGEKLDALKLVVE